MNKCRLSLTSKTRYMRISTVAAPSALPSLFYCVLLCSICDGFTPIFMLHSNHMHLKRHSDMGANPGPETVGQSPA